MRKHLLDYLLKGRENNEGAPFLETPDLQISYAQAWSRINKLAALVEDVEKESPRVGVLAQRDISSYYGTIAALASGCGYVSLSAKNPIERLKAITLQAELKTIIVGDGMEALFFEAFKGFPWPVTGISVSPQKSMKVTKRQATLHDIDDAPRHTPRHYKPVSSSDTAYLLFTSGSTGQPKGVPISHENVLSYLDFVCSQYNFNATDRLSQTFDLSFDLSVHDMMCAWTSGATLVPFFDKDLFSAARLIKDMKVTSWFSVPSQAALMMRMRAVQPDAFPDLRVSLFCGEPLPVRVADSWSRAAPNSIVENLYGPTEATIAITRHPWNADTAAQGAPRGLVPIGKPFTDQGVLLRDENMKPTQKGELILSGSQVFKGYWKNEKATKEKLSWQGYKTGDVVERDTHGVLHFVGRKDNQVKLHGHRIELAEVEDVLRKVSGTDFAVVLPWPQNNHEVFGLTAVVSEVESDTVLDRMREYLPAYMIPTRIEAMKTLPLTVSGKIDRKAILQHLMGSVEQAA